MTKTIFALAALAAIGFAGAAFAEDATTPKAMTDAEMDGVTAAGGPPPSGTTGLGLFTASQVSPLGVPLNDPLPNGVIPKKGTDTAASTPGQQP